VGGKVCRDCVGYSLVFGFEECFLLVEVCLFFL
jgi:hypothetical protein